MNMRPRPSLTVETLDFHLLAGAERRRILAEMIKLDSRVFSGAVPGDLLPYLEDPRAVAVKVVLYRDGLDLVGQNIIPILRLQVSGRVTDVFGSVAGLLPGYRRGARTHADALRVAVAHKLRHPLIPMVLVTSMMHPKVYEQFASIGTRLVPRPQVPLSPAQCQLVETWSRGAFTLTRNAEGIYVEHNLPVPQPTLAESARLASSTSPLQRFFEGHVPDYAQGRGLVCVLPLDLLTFTESLRSLGRRS